MKRICSNSLVYDAEVACWLYTGERQTSVIRSKGVQTLLKQDLGYFDNNAGNGVFVSQISNDILSVHSALSEKVRISMPSCPHDLITPLPGYATNDFT